MKKSWWTPDRIAMLIGLMVTLFGWGVTWGVMSGKVATQEEKIVELEAYKKEAEKQDTEQEINIRLNADAVDDIADILWSNIIGSRPGEEEVQDQD
jgi:hypothetical protein